MNGNLFRKELKRNLVRFLVWTGVIVAFELFTVAIVPSMIGGSAARMAAFLEIYPDALRRRSGSTSRPGRVRWGSTRPTTSSTA